MNVKKKRVLFLCTGNSCRSQMAEGLARYLAGEKWEVYSAGLEPQGVNAMAVEVMSERGIDISQQSSEVLDLQLMREMDLVITLCGDAAERCPFPPPGVRSFHWPLSDPAEVSGTAEEVRAAFRNVRDAIEEKISKLLASCYENE